MDPSEIKLKYDVPFEVSEAAFKIIMNNLSGTCAGRKEDNGRYFIKVWMCAYIKKIKQVIIDNPLIKA